jgi:ABC-2 type transport system permease protein
LIGMEIRRTLANGRYILFTIAWPVVFYLLFTSIYGGGSLDRLSVNRFLLVSMAAYGGLGAAFNANSTRLSMERASGWVRQLRATPLGAGAYVIGKTVMAALVVLPSLVAVGLAGVVFHHVSMPAGMWLRLGLALWLGTLPFALLGILVGYLFDSQTASSASTIIYLGLSLLGGLWIPIQVMPTALRDVARWTPSYRYADLGWRVLAGQAPSAADLVILGAYTLLFALAAARRYRLDEAREYA